MKNIYMHQYTFTKMSKENVGVQSIDIVIVTDSKEQMDFPHEAAIDFFDNDLNVIHKILMEGYTNE